MAWAGPDAADWGRLLDAPPALARALVCAAVRETFEESGVLLAGPAAGTLVADTSGPDWEADRTALLDRSLSLAQLLARRGLVLRSDLLRPWARWITPVTEARRYDTRFFAAALPPGQRTRDVGGEAEQVAWTRPADAIRAARARELFLLPPTAACLAGLAGYPDVHRRARRREHSMRPVIPAVVQVDGDVLAHRPGGCGVPPVTAGDAPLDGAGTARATYVLAPNPGPYDIERDQHVADRRAGRDVGGGGGPRTGRRSAPAPGGRAGRGGRAAGRPDPAHPRPPRSRRRRGPVRRADRGAGAGGRPGAAAG